MVIKLHLPAPLGPIWRIPPTEQNSDFAAWEDHRSADIVVSGPEVFAGNLPVMDNQPRYRPFRRARQPTSLRQHLTVVASHGDIERFWRRVDEENICRRETSTREG
jgi:hypothetical protein